MGLLKQNLIVGKKTEEELEIEKGIKEMRNKIYRIENNSSEIIHQNPLALTQNFDLNFKDIALITHDSIAKEKKQ